MNANITNILKKVPWPLVGIGLFGILLIVWGTFPLKKSPTTQVHDTPQVRPQKGEEEKLTELLSTLGIGNVKVMITYEDKGKKYLATDENIETEYENGKIKTMREDKEVVRMRQDNGETGYILHEQSPTVSGVVVTSSRPISTAQKLKVIEAVRALWDLPLGRIVVLGKE